MLVVPPIEINVECHNASGDHACDQGPVEEKEQRFKHNSSITSGGLSGRDWSMNVC